MDFVTEKHRFTHNRKADGATIESRRATEPTLMDRLRNYLGRIAMGNAVHQPIDRWCLELRPVQVDGYHNLHVVCRYPDGTSKSQLVQTNLTRSEAQDALTAAAYALERQFSSAGGKRT